MTQNDPVFLSLEQVLALHRRQLDEHGGLDGVRDMGLVESALASAMNTHHLGGGDVFDVAAAYAFHLAESQAFLDGNKRTALSAAQVFLAMNGVYHLMNQTLLVNAMLAIASRQLDKRELAGLFRKSQGLD